MPKKKINKLEEVFISKISKILSVSKNELLKKDDFSKIDGYDSLKHLERIARSLGYQVTSAEKFNIDIEIPKPENGDFMGTYTRKFEGDAHLTQISGALLMPWYMVMIEKC